MMNRDDSGPSFGKERMRRRLFYDCLISKPREAEKIQALICLSQPKKSYIDHLLSENNNGSGIKPRQEQFVSLRIEKQLQTLLTCHMTPLDSFSFSSETEIETESTTTMVNFSNSNNNNKHSRNNNINNSEEDQQDPRVWRSLNTSFKQVQSVLDRNRVLIQQVNENHQSKIPDNMVKNVALIHEINGNISNVVNLYSDMSTNFSSAFHQPSKDSDGDRDSGA